MNEFLIFVTKWMGLESILLNELSQTQQNKSRVILICGVRVCVHAILFGTDILMLLYRIKPLT